MTVASTQISTLPNAASTTQASGSPNSALIQAEAQQSAASGTAPTTSDPSASAQAVYPLATMPPVRDPSSSDPLLGFAAEAQAQEASNTSAGTAAAQTLLNESEQVLNAFQTALGVWTTM